MVTGLLTKVILNEALVNETESTIRHIWSTGASKYRQQRFARAISSNIKANQALIDPAISSKKWCGIVRSLYGYNKCYSAIPAIYEGDV